MANIAFIKTPPALNLTGNKINLRIVGKNAYNGLYSVFRGTLIIHQPLADGDHVTFNWGEKTITLQCVAVPGDSVFEFAQVATNLEFYNVLIKCADLVADFDIQDPTGKESIDIVARKNGSAYNLSRQSNRNMSITLGRLDASDIILNANYKIGVMVEQDSALLAKMEYPVEIPTADELATFPNEFQLSTTGVFKTDDLGDFLKETINGNFTFPTPLAGYSTIQDIVKSFRIYAYEKLAVGNIGIYSQLFRYLQGKLSDFRQGELNFLGKSVYDKLAESKMFLSWAPVEKITDIYAPERLSFLFLEGGNYTLKSKEYFDDSSISENSLVTFAAASWELREFFVEYSKIRTNAPKKVVKYEIYLTDATGDLISEVRTFIIDYKYQQYARYFHFKNSWGVYELLRTTGKVTKTQGITKEFITLPLPSDFTEKDKAEKQIDVQISTSYKFNTGYLPDKYFADWMQEFLSSDDVYWLKKGIAYPVNIQSSKNPVSQDGDYNPYQEFDLTHSIHDDFTEEFSAHEPILVGDFNIDFNTDFFVGQNGTPPVDPTQIYAEEFDTWVNDAPGDVNYMPEGWWQLGTIVTRDGDKLVMTWNPAGGYGSADTVFKPNAFAVTPPPGMNMMQVKVTVKIDALTSGAGFAIQFNQNSDGSGFTINRGINETGTIEEIMTIPIAWSTFMFYITAGSATIDSVLIQDLGVYSYNDFYENL